MTLIYPSQSCQMIGIGSPWILACPTDPSTGESHQIIWYALLGISVFIVWPYETKPLTIWTPSQRTYSKSLSRASPPSSSGTDSLVQGIRFFMHLRWSKSDSETDCLLVSFRHLAL